MLTLFTGGARSGKSTAAVRRAIAGGAPVAFLATGEAGDDEMAVRIARHRAERPAAWTTVEAPVAVVDALEARPDGETVIVDCLTLWVANLVAAGWDDERVVGGAEALARAARARVGDTIVVTNEVGSGLVPMAPESRRYRDLLGTVNARVAVGADEAYLIVAGRALVLGAIT